MPYHTKQQDSVSCEVFCLKVYRYNIKISLLQLLQFAECIIKKEEILAAFVKEDVNNFRKKIGETISKAGGRT